MLSIFMYVWITSTIFASLASSFNVASVSLNPGAAGSRPSNYLSVIRLLNNNYALENG
jgi:hypothetical protein